MSKEELGPEHLAPLLRLNNAKDIMDVWEIGAHDRHDAGLLQLLTRLQTGKINRKQFLEREKELDTQLHAELPVRDPLTGAYGHKELFTFMKLCHDLGYERVLATVLDLEHLKDYNNLFGEPVGGDYALRVVSAIAGQVAEENHHILIRYQGAGGDDFIVLGFPPEGSSSEFIGTTIQQRLSTIDAEKLLSGTLNENPVTHFTTGERLMFDPVLVKRVREEKAEVLKIIIPPYMTFEAVEINPLTDVDTLVLPSGSPVFNFKAVADSIQTAMARIKEKKSARLTDLSKINPTGVSYLSRRPNNA